MNTQIKFDCTRCGQEMEGDADYEFQKVTCPNCQEEFFPKPKKTAIQRDAARAVQNIIHDPSSPTQPISQKFSDKDLDQRRRKIRGQAHSFVFIAVLFLIGCLVMTVVSFNDPHFGLGMIVAGSLLSFALWFFLVAQIIHIRANTEK